MNGSIAEWWKKILTVVFVRENILVRINNVKHVYYSLTTTTTTTATTKIALRPSFGVWRGMDRDHIEVDDFSLYLLSCFENSNKQESKENPTGKL